MADDGVQPVDGATSRRRPVRKASVNSFVVQRNAKVEKRERVKKVTDILKRSESERTAAEKLLLKKNPDIVRASENNARRLQATKDRVLEIEDEPDDLARKCDELADLIGNSSRIVVYTGAGISTAASIPDYRGPNGVWTLLKKGQALSAQDLSDAEPTFTHMSITKLFRTGRVKHVVSQNCDGLHIRSGYPRYALSEVHGNMFIECCYNCEPHREYIRLFDVTEKTGVRRHTTNRKCRTCSKYLTDTIVHFGEKGKIKSPYRWKEAVRAAKSSDLILCLGSSLKILKRYTCLWCMDKKPSQRPKLVIVNLQWTPKDDTATLKINGRCDEVMRQVMEKLEYNVPDYRREFDPIFKFCTPLRAVEKKTTNKKILVPPEMPSKASVKAAVVAKTSKSRRKSTKQSTTCSKSSSDISTLAPPSTPTSSSSSFLSPSSTSTDTTHAFGESQCSSVDLKKEQVVVLNSVKSEGLGSGEELERKCDVVIKCESGPEDRERGNAGLASCGVKSEVLDCKSERNSNGVGKLEGIKSEKCDSYPSLNQKPLESLSSSLPSSSFLSSSLSSTASNNQSHLTLSSVAQTNKRNSNDKPVYKTEVFPNSISPSILTTSQSNNTRLHMSISSTTTALTSDSISLSPSRMDIDRSACNTNHDSIGLLLVSQPPKCLTDVRSLDLNSKNPSAFPVCRIELPAIESTELSAKEDSSSLLTRVDDGNRAEPAEKVDECLDPAPSTVIVDLEMMENIGGGGGGNVSPEIKSGVKISVDLELDRWSCDLSSLPMTKSSPVTNTMGSSVGVLSPNSAIVNLDLPPVSLNNNNTLDLNKALGVNNSLILKSDVASSLYLSQKKCIPPPPYPHPLKSALISSQPAPSTNTNPKTTSTSSTSHSPFPSHSSSSSSLSPSFSAVSLSSYSSSSSSPLPTTSVTTNASPCPVPQAMCHTSTNPPPLQCSSQKSSTSQRNPFSPLPTSPSSSLAKMMNHPKLTVTSSPSSSSSNNSPKNVKDLTSPPIPSSTTNSTTCTTAPHRMSTQLSSSSSLSSLTSLSSTQTSYQNPIRNHLPIKPVVSPISSPPSLDKGHPKPEVIPKWHPIQNGQSLASCDTRGKISDILKNLSKSDIILPNGSDISYKAKIGMDNILLKSSTILPHKICERYETQPNLLKSLNNAACTTSTVCVPTQQKGGMCSSVFSVSKQHGHNHTPGDMAVSSKPGVASCVLNMDDLFASNSLLPFPLEPVPALSVLKHSERNSIVGSTGHSERNSIVGSTESSGIFTTTHVMSFGQNKSFCPEYQTQTPNKATSLISKTPTTPRQANSLDQGTTLSENTDIPHKEERQSATNSSPLFIDPVSKSTSSSDGHFDLESPSKRTDPISWRCVQKASTKRCHPNRNTIVLKADWGTPLTPFLTDPPPPLVTSPKTKMSTDVGPCSNSKDKTSPKNSLKRSPSVQDHSQPHFVSKCLDKDLGLPAIKKAKRPSKVKDMKKPVVQKRKKPVVSNNNKNNKNKNNNSLNPPSSLPGWFGKGLAIKRKKKS